MNLDGLVAALKKDEGFRALAYDDATGEPIKAGTKLVGHPTIGYGWNLSTDPMTEIEAEDKLRRRCIRAYQDAAELVPLWVLLGPVRQNVLANMAYNLGKARLAKFKKMLAAVNDSRFADAAHEMRDSVWFMQVGDRGERLAREMETGEEA